MTDQAQHSVALRPGDALVVVDVQNDFLPGGTLGVKGGDGIIEPLNRIITRFREKHLPVFFSRDWHPPEHSSFMKQGGPWPVHCVQNTKGASFSGALDMPVGATIISKGTQVDEEQYSAMYGRDEAGKTLEGILKSLGIRRIFIGGLATDYCVLNTVKDAARAGFESYVMTDAVAAVDVRPGDGGKALREMAGEGAMLITTTEAG